MLKRRLPSCKVRRGGSYLLHGGNLPGPGRCHVDMLRTIFVELQSLEPVTSSSSSAEETDSAGGAHATGQTKICTRRRTCSRPSVSLSILQSSNLFLFWSFVRHELDDSMPPKPPTTINKAEDAQKQRQTNLEIDLLKSAWIQKDRETPPSTGKQ
uniref:Uncharacterized protein n=1 Tax=Hyaloperonospora arabidopsidis (strain Emoy2) TaxID=559515 RepID=M4BLN8_HYAAE